MPYWRCFFHVVWATKHRQPIITPIHEPLILAAIKKRCTQLKCTLHGINMVPDHLHMAISIPPSQAPATIIGQLKAVSSGAINRGLSPTDQFEWQNGYGLLTFGEKVMPQVLDYIVRQKEHHRDGTIFDYLESIED